MYEEIIKRVRIYVLGSDNVEPEILSGCENTLTDGKVKLVSNGNITFEGEYLCARIMEKKNLIPSN